MDGDQEQLSEGDSTYGESHTDGENEIPDLKIAISLQLLLVIGDIDLIPDGGDIIRHEGLGSSQTIARRYRRRCR